MKMMSSIAAATALMVAGMAMADDGPNTILIDVAGVTSNGFEGDASNDVLTLPGFQAGDIIHSVKWDINVSTVSPSWADEMNVGLTDTGNDNKFLNIEFFPGLATTVTNFAGSGMSSAGDYVMTGSSINLEFYEDGFDDIIGPDAIYNSGTIRVNYTAIPGPGVLAVLGAAGLFGRKRRRA